MHVRLSLGSSALACAVAGLIATATQPAQATTSCVLPPRLLAPPLNATDVPTNTLIWCQRSTSEDPGNIRVTTSSSSALSGTPTSVAVGVSELLVFHPSEALAPNTEYFVSCGEGSSQYTFTTGDGPLQEPAVLSELIATGESFAKEHYFDNGVSYTGAWVEVASESRGLLLLDVGVTATLDAAGPAGKVTGISGVGAGLNRVLVGSGRCGGDWLGDLGESTTVRVGALSWAGEFSGWTEPVTITLPDHYEGEPSSGCVLALATGGDAGAAMASAGALLALAAVRMRRRRRHCSG